MAKRGRKRTKGLYFGPEQEEAVVKFLNTEDEKERNAIYNKWLREPFDKMIESIIRKYELYRDGETFQDLHNDTLSYLITKADKFQVSKGKKAYSYYGTICKHYLLGLIMDDDKQNKRLSSYENVAPILDEKKEYQYELTDIEFTFKKLIDRVVNSIEEELEGKNLANKKKLTENEIKVGLGLIDILSDWERLLDLMNGGNKYNKISFLESMRRYTGLTTKDIRLAMKRYKEVYEIIKLDSLENGIE